MDITIEKLFALTAEKATGFIVEGNASTKRVTVTNPEKPLNYIIFEIWATELAITTYVDNKWDCGGDTKSYKELEDQLEALLENIK